MSFEAHSKYSSTRFSLLNERLNSESAIDRYYSKWTEKYAAVFKGCKARTAIDWDVRTSKSLKEIFTAVAFYVEAQACKKLNAWSAFYFLSYYSLFHALLANVYLLPEEQLQSLSEITHTKLINVFYSTFANSKPKIMNGEVKSLFEVLKWTREYYSYQMPFNDFLYSHNDLNKPDARLEYYLRASFQLASLHSEIIEKSFQKHGKVVRGAAQLHNYKKQTFMRANARKHPVTDKYILDPSDEYRIRDLISGSVPTSFIVNLEHYCDEFRSYVSSELEEADDRELQSDTITFIYSALC
jgi:hypothetical protein